MFVCNYQDEHISFSSVLQLDILQNNFDIVTTQ